MLVGRIGRAVVVAVVIATLTAAALITGCSSPSEAGKRISRGFIASDKSKSHSFKGALEVKLPPLAGDGSAVLIKIDGRYDGRNSDSNYGGDIQLNLSIKIGSQTRRLQYITTGGKDYIVSGDTAIGGPAATDDVSENDWQRILAAIAESAKDLAETGSATVDGTRLDFFKARLEKDVVCKRLVPLFESLTMSDPTPGGGGPSIGRLCTAGLVGPVAIGIGLDKRDWPRLFTIDATTDLGALAAGAAGGGDKPLSLKVPLTARIEITGYNEPVQPVTAPKGAKMHGSVAEMQKAEDKLTDGVFL